MLRGNDKSVLLAAGRGHTRHQSGEGRMVLPGVDVFLHAANWLSARDGSAPLNNHEALTTQFPLRFRPGAGQAGHTRRVVEAGLGPGPAAGR